MLEIRNESIFRHIINAARRHVLGNNARRAQLAKPSRHLAVRSVLSVYPGAHILAFQSHGVVVRSKLAEQKVKTLAEPRFQISNRAICNEIVVSRRELPIVAKLHRSASEPGKPFVELRRNSQETQKLVLCHIVQPYCGSPSVQIRRLPVNLPIKLYAVQQSLKFKNFNSAFSVPDAKLLPYVITEKRVFG